MMRIFKICLAVFLVVCAQCCYGATITAATTTTELAASVVKIKALRINNSLTKNGQTEMFMDLQNTGSQPHSLVAIYTPLAKQVQLHDCSKNNLHPKAMTMEQLNSIAIPAHKDEELHYGGLHVMLIGLDKALNNQDEVPITLIFKDGSWLTVNASVFTAPATA